MSKKERKSITNKQLLELSYIGKLYKKRLDLYFKYKNDINYQDESKNTALILASGSGHIKIVKLLLENGAILYIRNKWNCNALIIALDRKRFDVINLLLKNKFYHNKIMKLKKINLNQNKLYGKKILNKL